MKWDFCVGLVLTLVVGKTTIGWKKVEKGLEKRLETCEKAYKTGGKR